MLYSAVLCVFQIYIYLTFTQLHTRSARRLGTLIDRCQPITRSQLSSSPSRKIETKYFSMVTIGIDATVLRVGSRFE